MKSPSEMAAEFVEWVITNGVIRPGPALTLHLTQLVDVARKEGAEAMLRRCVEEVDLEATRWPGTMVGLALSSTSASLRKTDVESVITTNAGGKVMYGKQHLQTHQVWRHVATNSLYHVLGVARCSTNGERENREESVVYFSMDYQALRYRELSEFLDGRFEPVEPAKR